eukprot:scaffold316170_cov15-Prasinocladus_malaysianus.AAC.2
MKRGDRPPEPFEGRCLHEFTCLNVESCDGLRSDDKAEVPMTIRKLPPKCRSTGRSTYSVRTG